MNPEHLESLRVNLKKHPDKVLQGARRGVKADIVVLGNYWTDDLGLAKAPVILDVFAEHLKEQKVPSDVSARVSEEANCAFSSLLGVSKIGVLLSQPNSILPKVIKMWPGILRWSQFLIAARVQTTGPGSDPARSKAALDVIATCWVSLMAGSEDELGPVMRSTPGAFDVAAQLWLREDEGILAAPGAKPNIPPGTYILGTLCKYADAKTLNTVLRCTGGKATTLAKLALARLRSAIKGPQLSNDYITLYSDFVNSMCRISKHKLRYAFLSANSIWTATKILVAIAPHMSTPAGRGYLDAMTAALGYLANCLNSTDGVVWVVQCLNAGFISAYCDCSARFGDLEKEDRDMALSIVKDILPRYLVYRSVIQALNEPMLKFDNGPQRERVTKSIAKDAFFAFHALALERKLVLETSAVLQGQQRTCDNCQKVDSKSNFQKCTACLSTFYCSKECQVRAWKEGDHKSVCKMKQQQRADGKQEGVSKADFTFFHRLSLRDARRQLPRYRALAARTHPDVPETGFIYCLDYSTDPAGAISLKLLSTYANVDSDGSQSSKLSEARNDAMLEKVRKSPERFVLVESTVVRGEGHICVLTLGTGNLRMRGPDIDIPGPDDDWEPEDVEDLPGVDGVDLMMGRMALNGFLRSIGEPETF